MGNELSNSNRNRGYKNTAEVEMEYISALLSLIAISASLPQLGVTWDHEDQTSWTGACQTGTSGSPIDIATSLVQHDAALPDLTFAGYSNTDGFKLEVENDGHSLKFNVLESCAGENALPILSGGGLPGSYRLAQFHFHWGCTNNVGSEHSLDHHTFPAELHFVHWNIDEYSSLSEAAASDNGLAVLGVWLKLDTSSTAAMTELISDLTLVEKKDESWPVRWFDLAQLIPSDAATRFYRYAGGLTTPTCDESVVWTVAASTISITQAQLDEFRKLIDINGNALVNNFREIQALGSRNIYSNFQ